MNKIYVGCCGFPVSKDKYFKEFNCVELQNTFYNIPSIDEAKKLRSSIPPDIIITMKCWQVITHPPTSPTWKKIKFLPPGNIDNYGLLKPTRENLEAWNKVYEIAKILGAKVIVIQTPPSFEYNDHNLSNLELFLKEINKEINGNTIIAWEPRGNWNEHKEVLETIINKYNIIHVTDILKVMPVINNMHRIVYTRLHGLGRGDVNYRYKYSDQDLLNLLAKIKDLISQNIEEIFVLFNNVYMFEDAKRFKSLLSSQST